MNHRIRCNLTRTPSIATEDFVLQSHWIDEQLRGTDQTRTSRPQRLNVSEQYINGQESNTQILRDKIVINSSDINMILNPTTPVENLCLAIRYYIVGSFEGGAWIIDGGDIHSRSRNIDCDVHCFGGKSESANLYTLIRHSRQLFDSGDLENGGVCLRRGFSHLQMILKREDPFTVWELMNTVSYLREAGWTEVLRSFLNQLTDLSAVTHSRFHPIYHMFEKLRGLMPAEMLHIIALMRQCAAEEVEKVIGHTSLGTLKLKLGWLRSVSLVQDQETVENVFKVLLQRSQTQFGKDGIQSLLILNRIGSSLHERKLFAEAEATGWELVSCANGQRSPDAVIAFKGRGLALMSRAQFAQGKYDEAGRSLDHLLDFNIAHYGWADPLTIDTMMLRELCMEACGEDLKAEKIRAQRLRLIRESSDL